MNDPDLAEEVCNGDPHRFLGRGSMGWPFQPRFSGVDQAKKEDVPRELSLPSRDKWH